MNSYFNSRLDYLNKSNQRRIKMSEDKVRVQTSDGDILEVDLDVAKQWGPINNMYEGKIYPKKFFSFNIIFY
jgi:hypothetical protein